MQYIASPGRTSSLPSCTETRMITGVTPLLGHDSLWLKRGPLACHEAPVRNATFSGNCCLLTETVSAGTQKGGLGEEILAANLAVEQHFR